MESTTDLVTASVGNLTIQEDEKTFWQMNLGEKFSFVRKVITVEPLIAAYVMASTLCVPALYQLEYEKSCRVNLNLNDSVCEAILTSEHDNYTEVNIQIQILISNMHSWQQPLQSVMPLILVLFLGSFSDRHKWRKPFLIIPLLGEFLAVAACILCVFFMKTWPLEAQGVSQTVIPSFFGGQTMIVMAVFAYIADVSTIEMRTLRVGVVQIVLNTCVPIVQSFSGILFQEIGYYGILLLAGFLYLFALLYGIFCIKEPRQPVTHFKQGMLCDMFDPRHAIETLKLMFKKNAGNDRVYISVLLLILFVYSGVVVGESSIFYLYSQSQFKWTIVDFSYFISLNTLVHLIGTLLGVPLFTELLKLTDIVILFLTFFDKILSNLVFGFANTNTLLYAAAIVSFLTGISPVAIRSLATKVVSENDLGKSQSLFGIIEALAPAVAIPIYNKGVYNNTLQTLPSAFFFFGLLLYTFCCFLMIFIFIRERRQISEEKQKAKQKQFPQEKFTQTTVI